MIDRKQAITMAIQSGQNASQISKGLESIGEKPLNKFETAQINNNTYGMNLAGRFGKDIQNFVSGLGTIGGAAILAAMPERGKAIRQQASEALSNYSNQILSGQRNPLEDLINFSLQPYGTSAKGILENPVNAAGNIVAGAWANPFTAALDVMPIVPKGLPSQALSKLDTPLTKDLRTFLFPTQRESSINRILQRSEISRAPEAKKLTRQAQELANDKNLAKAIENLETGTIAKGTEKTTEKLKSFSQMFGDLLRAEGVEQKAITDTAVNQYVYRMLNPNMDKDFFVQDIARAVDNPTKESLNKIGLNSQDELNNLVSQGQKLFGEGLITPITHRTSSINTPHGAGYGSDKTGIFADRYLGSASYDELARNFERGYNQLYNQLTSARASRESLDLLAKDFGNKTDIDNVKNLTKDDIVISPKAFNEELSNLFKEGKQSDVRKFTDDFLDKGLNKSELKDYADDLYIVNKNDLKALRNAYGERPDSGLYRFLTAVNPLLSSFKSTVLARPSYVISNRLSNLLAGITGGSDYVGLANQILRGRMDDIIPDYLKTSTSFHGLSPSLTDVSPVQQFKTGLRRAGEYLQDVKNPELSFGQRAQSLLEGLNEVQQSITRPIFQAESTGELLDRMAAYVRAAGDEAQRTRQSVDKILDRARTDVDLQGRLIDKVNTILGDYVNANQFVSPTFRSIVNNLIPFNRVITATGSVFANQLRDNPLSLYMTTRMPSRIGQDIQKLQSELGNQPSDNDTRGGVVFTPSYSNRFPAQVLYNSYHPFIAPFESLPSLFGIKANRYDKTGLAGQLGEWISQSPVVGALNALQGLDAYGNAPVGNNTYTVNGKLVTLDNNGNKVQQDSDVVGALANYFGRNFLPIATLANEVLLPFAASLQRERYYRPTNRSIFGQIGEGQSPLPYLFEGRTNDVPYNNPTLYVPRQFGGRLRNVYRDRPQQLSERDFNTIMQQRLRQNIMRANFE